MGLKRASEKRWKSAARRIYDNIFMFRRNARKYSATQNRVIQLGTVKRVQLLAEVLAILVASLCLFKFDFLLSTQLLWLNLTDSFTSPNATDKGLTHSKTFKITPPATVISRILFEKITDSFPVLALGMEKADDDVMNRPPERAEKSLFSKTSLASIPEELSKATRRTLSPTARRTVLQARTRQTRGLRTARSNR